MTANFNPEIFELNEPITVYCVNAKSFPQDVQKAHETLHGLAPLHPSRKYFGISWGGPTITYKAGATEVEEDELKNKDLEKFVIRKGKYLAILLKDMSKIPDAIQFLIKDARIDPNGYCVEMYLENNKVRCMVIMDDKSQ